MAFSKTNRANTLNGIFLVSLFALSAMYIAELPWVEILGFSPLVIAIIFGMIYGNTLRHKLPAEWVPGVIFCSKNILRFAIVFYGFRITYQQVFAVGAEALLLDAIIVSGTFVFGWFLGTKVFGIDRDSSMLIGSGASICGAAAVLATESTLKSEPYKTAMAVATVVLFGTLGMFLYPVLFKYGFLLMDPKEYGIYVGATVHEVAQVVVAGSAVNKVAGDTAVIVKMTRVMMLAPFLVILSYFLTKNRPTKGDQNKKPDEKSKIVIPWFAVYFLLVAGFNSLNLLPKEIVSVINNIDTILLAMAMAALGIETNFSKLKNVGLKPFILAGMLFVWLIFGGYILTKGIGAFFA
ncbi:YeiH family protein [Microaerobacter geothermalis]|uniref:YeiH family protein n=1 Tax=Microaerobacter geothermalis TaxID=674972 RepID=UPI001F313D61|nr:YeiH family protein [Microaerobacter geothermalis]MCF6094379.1 YeiH family protein [Microaerobacter geothermalis]